MKAISPEVLNVLANAECQGNALKLIGQLDRKLYMKTNEVLEAIGGTWNRNAKAHLFEGMAEEIVESAILLGTFSKEKQDFGFFETPNAVIEQMLRHVGSLEGKRVLEPSAGRGAIADRLRAEGAIVFCVELMPKNAEVLESKRYTVHQVDFLSINPSEYPSMDYVIMNPPFAKRADIHHIMHATRFLRNSGKLVSIASAGVRFRNDQLGTQFRNFLNAHGAKIEDLPEGSFRESGTGVNAVLIDLIV